MTSRSRHLAVLLLLLALVPLSLHKSRSARDTGRAAFVRYTAGTTVVAFRGEGGVAGVHRFPGTVTVDSVNKMTGIKGLCRDGDDRIGGEVLQSGDLVTYRRSPAGCMTVAVKTVTTAEKILLGIPLDPNRMTYDDWVALPGIGPAMATAIVHDRQKNGDYAGAESLQRVPGLGRARVEALSAYFK